MMRFYGLTDRDILAMPFPRFQLLYRTIDQLEAEEEMRHLVVQHTNDPAERFEVLQGHIHGRSSRKAGKTSGQVMDTPSSRLFASYVDSEQLLAERARQQAVDEQRRAEWESKRQ